MTTHAPAENPANANANAPALGAAARAARNFGAREFLAAFPRFAFDVGGGVRMSYVDAGPPDAPPVLMLHGNPTWSYMFREPLAELRDPRRAELGKTVFRVVVVDHVGCGMSDKPGDDRYQYTLQRRSEDLAKLLDHLGLRSGVRLVAHDWGGLVGMDLASRERQRFARVALMNTAAFHLPPDRRFPRELALARLPVLGAFLVRGLNLFCSISADRCAVRPLPPHVRRAYLAPYSSYANRIAVHRFVQDVPIRPGDRNYERLARVAESLPSFADTPFWIGWGRRDFIFDEPFLNQWRKRVPFARFHLYPDAGHYLMEDDPDHVVPDLVRFVEDDARPR